MPHSGLSSIGIESPHHHDNKEDKDDGSFIEDSPASTEDYGSSPASSHSKCLSLSKKIQKNPKNEMEKLSEEEIMELVHSENIDGLITYFGQQYRKDWKKISKRIKNLTGKSMSAHKIKNTFKQLTESNPILYRIKFTTKDDLMIVKYNNLYNLDWQAIAARFKGRDKTMIKNRYYGSILKKGKETNPDQLLEFCNKIESCGFVIDNIPESHPIFYQDKTSEIGLIRATLTIQLPK
mmetsp:Transcript_33064/g.29959  ORF Transcript_33064/g.29959 Transcript_33064/m.29959 type:complete len:236 (-) Transcript_33064:265-972(-)